MKGKFVTKIIAFMLCVSLMNLPAIFANSEDYQNIEGYEQFERLNNMMIEGIEETEEIYNSEMMEYIEYDDTRFIDKGISIYDQYMADEENKIELMPVTDEELAILQNNYYNQSKVLEYPFEFNIISDNGNDILIELIPYVTDYEFSISIPSVKGDVYNEKRVPVDSVLDFENISPFEPSYPFEEIRKSSEYILLTADTEYTFNFVEISGDIKNTYIGNIKLTSYISDYGKVISDNFSSEPRMVDDIFQEKSTTIEIYAVYEYTSYNEDLSNERMENDLLSPIMSLMGVGTKYEVESNNTYSSSDLTYDDYDNYGMISYSGDIDWWRVSFSSSGDANFWLGNIPSNCDYDIQLVSSNGSTVIGSSTKGGTADELITYAVTANTTYYVKVYGYNSYSSSQYYWFRAKNYPTQGSTGDIYEPNNTTGTSTILGNSPSGTLTANIHATSDIDFYRFNMTTARNFSVYLSNIPSGCNYDIQLLNSSGSVIGISNNGGTNIEYIDLSLPVGTYYIRVYSSSGYNLASNYSLTMSTYTGGSTGGDQYEPNDSTSNARTVALNTTISANIHSTTDADFYRITVTHTMTLSLSLTNIPSGCDYDMRLLDSMGSVITSSAVGGNGNESISRSLTQGTYFIQIYPYSGYNANSNYSLAIGAGGGSTPGGDQYEPNNTQGSATNIGSQPNTTIYSSIHVTDDVDCFKFTLTSVSNVTITLSNAPSTCHYSATIRDANLGFASDIIFSGQGTNSSTTTAYSLPIGTYYIAVIPYMGYSATTNYRLDVSSVINASGGGDTYEPNNSTATAYNIGTNPLTSIQATIHNTSDVDYYKFTLNSSYVTSINLSTISSGCDYDLTLLNSSGVAIQGSEMAGTYPENILRTLSSGTYYIKVHSYSGYSSGNKYTLNVYVGSDDYEYNDTIENATNLGTLSNTANASYTYDSSVTDEVPFESEQREFNEYIGEKSPLNTIDSLSTEASSFIVYAKISTASDIDTYKIQVTAGQTFEVKLSNVPSSCNYRFQIKNSNAQVVYTSVSGAGTTKTCSYTPPSTGLYYLEIYTTSGYSSSSYYNLSVTSIATGNQSGKRPVILIHGRTDNTTGIFGATNTITTGNNLHFNSSLTANSLNGYQYIARQWQAINSISATHAEGGNLAYYLENNGYTRNVNLFVFNYPNHDTIVFNAQKFSSYINNLIAEGYFGANDKIDIIGHSMGGLVARYYIENLGNSSKVNKLITLNTPHWGAEMANVSCNIGTNEHVLCDHDLRTNSAVFGGNMSTSLNCNTVIGNCGANNGYNLTPTLNYLNHGSTKYYAIVGIDYSSAGSNSNDTIFEIPNNLTTYNAVNDVIKSSTNNSMYKWITIGMTTGLYYLNVEDYESDNIVEVLSQLGWTNNSGTTPNKKIQFNKICINIDSNGGNFIMLSPGVPLYTPDGHYHGKMPHRNVVMEKVKNYLLE